MAMMLMQAVVSATKKHTIKSFTAYKRNRRRWRTAAAAEDGLNSRVEFDFHLSDTRRIT